MRGQTPRAPAPSPPEGQRQGSEAREAAAHPADLELQLAVQTTVYHWLQAFHDLRRRGKPDREIGCRQTHSATPSRVSDPRPRHEPSMRRPRAAPWRQTQFRWPTCPSTKRRRAPSQSRCRSPLARGANRATEMPPMCRQVLQKRGNAGTPGVARSAHRRLGGRQGGGLPDPRGEGREVPVTSPCTPSAPRARRPATRGARRRRPERPRRPAVQPNKDPSPRDWPRWPLCGPRWERAPHTTRPQHTQETWLLQRTLRQCRCGTADSRRTRRTTP